MASQLIADTGAVSGISGLRYASDSSGVLQILTGAGGVAVTLDANQVMTLGSALNEVQGADIASAATVNLTASTGNYINVTGTTTITAITLAQGAERTVKFAGALALTNGASLILPSGANITTAAGDVAIFRGEAAGVVRCVSYMKANGQAVVAPAAGVTSVATGNGLQGGTITSSGTLSIAAPTQNTVGCYAYGISRNTSGSAITMTFGNNYSAGSANGQIQSLATTGWDASTGLSRVYSNNLSGTWKYLGPTASIPASDTCLGAGQLAGLFVRVS